MNATTVQKWIRKNAPEYRLVRTQYVETLQAETTRADLAEELVRSLGREIVDLDADVTEARKVAAAEHAEIVEELDKAAKAVEGLIDEVGRQYAELEILRGVAAAHDVIPDRRVEVSGGPASVIAADKVVEEGVG